MSPGEDPTLEAARDPDDFETDEDIAEAEAFRQHIEMEVRKAEILDRSLDIHTFRCVFSRVLERLARIEQTLEQTALFLAKFETAPPRVVFTRPALCMNPTPSECKRSVTLMGRTYCDQADDSSDYCCHLAPF